ncbi:Alpha/Beta hydrolase protein [Mycena capillaripes]|nr:Alpha/Beta hydrolase protein [Mycena capillaripes]
MSILYSGRGVLFHLPSLLLYLVMAYGIILGLILMPYMQTLVVYAHHRGFSAMPNLLSLENYGLAPGKTLNLYITSADNTTLGAWFGTSDKYYRSLPFPVKTVDILVASKKRLTILYLHGNSGDRSISRRIAVYSALSSRLDANILALDYHSEGHPTIAGVASDAEVNWNHLTNLGAKPEEILIVGHSLGGTVGGLLAAKLSEENINPRGLGLLAPFASLKSILHDFKLFGLVPIKSPPFLFLSPTPVRFSATLHTRLISQFISFISWVEDDLVFAHAHADMLFNAFLEPLLPDLSPTHSVHMDWIALRKEVVTFQQIPAFGTLEKAQTDGHRLALLKTVRGTHDNLRVEGVQDVIARMFNFA